MHDMANMVGMGCFAKTDTLRRVFGQALERYILGKYEDICPRSDLVFNEENLTCFFRSVISRGAGAPHQANPVPGFAKITGFYLGLKNRNLYLIVFFRGDGQEQTKCTTRLEQFTRLRENRLH
jgi:hypothetical protein